MSREGILFYFILFNMEIPHGKKVLFLNWKAADPELGAFALLLNVPVFDFKLVSEISSGSNGKRF